MLILAVGLAVARSVLVGSVPSRSAAATAVAFDVLFRFLREGLRTLLVLGLVVALGAFLAGPSVTAVRLRAGAKQVLDGLRERGDRAGLRTGRFGGWVHTYRGALRATAVGLAALVFVFLDRPSGAAVLVLAVLLLACLALIQFFAQPSTSDTR